MAHEYDLIVIGAGTGGYVAAIRAAQLGLKVAVVEKQKALGGTCLLWGCIPTKALLEHAHALKIARQAKEWGITFGPSTGAAPEIGIDMAQVQSRKDRIVGGLSKGVEYLFKKNKIDWIKGTARLTGNGGVDVFEGDAQTLRATREIIVATGSLPARCPWRSDRPAANHHERRGRRIARSPARDRHHGERGGRRGVRLDFPPLRQRGHHSRAAATARPGRGRCGVRGARKVVPQARHHCHTGAKVTGATATGDGVDIDAQLADGTSQRIRADYLLVATGRGPVTAGLDVERLGVQLEKGYIKVDAQYRTTVPGISAIGDVVTLGTPGHPQLAHVSSAEGIIAAERIAGQTPRPINYQHVPGCTYCDPEIGSVGLTEREARARGYDVRIGTFPFGVLGRAKMAGETEGFVKIVAENKNDELLGFHMIGLRSTELVAEATVALRLESTVEELIRTIHAHPTMAEAVGEAAHAVHGTAIHI